MNPGFLSYGRCVTKPEDSSEMGDPGKNGLATHSPAGSRFPEWILFSGLGDKS